MKKWTRFSILALVLGILWLPFGIVFELAKKYK
jgi:hypothetical protein